MSTAAQQWAIPFDCGSPVVKMVLVVLAFYADDDGLCEIGIDRLVQGTGFSNRSVRSAIRTLTDRGLVARYVSQRFKLNLALSSGRVAPPYPTKEERILDSEPSGSTLVYGVAPAEWAKLRRYVFARDQYRCTYCSSSEYALHCDHKTAWSRGGATTVDNLTTACGPCNIGKKARSADEWIAILRSRSSTPALNLET